MADQFSSAPFIYPQGSFYQDLDNRLKSLEAILGTGVGQLPDGAVSEFKLADSSVTTRAIKDAQVTGPKLNAATSAALGDTDRILARTAAGLLVSTAMTQFVTALFTTTRNITNATFLSTLRIRDTTTPTKGLAFNCAAIAASTVRTISMPNRDVNLGDIYSDFSSAALTPTMGGLVQAAHGLGAQPTYYQAFVQCVTAEFGWAVGDEVSVTTDHVGTQSGYGIQVYADATNIYGRIGNTGLALIFTKGTGAQNPAPTTITNWKVILRARK